MQTVKLLAKMWQVGLPPILAHLQKQGITPIQFFQIEKYICFNVSAMVHDINMINIEIFNSRADASSFATRAAHGFLPVLVYQLEEYGLPRMISRKIHLSGLIDLESDDATIHEILNQFISLGTEKLHAIPDIDEFDEYVITHFMDGLE